MDMRVTVTQVCTCKTPPQHAIWQAQGKDQASAGQQKLPFTAELREQVGKERLVYQTAAERLCISHLFDHAALAKWSRPREGLGAQAPLLLASHAQTFICPAYKLGL